MYPQVSGNLEMDMAPPMIQGPQVPRNEGAISEA